MSPEQATPSDILSLQRAYGNRAVHRLIQTQLTVGPAGDRYEQEADRVAEQVLSMPAPTPAQPAQRQSAEEEEIQMQPLAASITPLLQRQEEEEVQAVSLRRQEEEEELQASPSVQRQEEEEEIQTRPLLHQQEEDEELQTMPLLYRQEEEELQAKPLLQPQEEEEVQMTPLLQQQEEEEELQTKPLSYRAGGAAPDALESQIMATKGSGGPLPDEARAFMERRFGADFSDVRVHTDVQAVQLNRQISAQAFTHGQDIYVGEGRYAPDTAAGKRLLAHELTHVVQQTGHIWPRIQRWTIGSWFTNKGHETITEESVAEYNKMAQTENAKVEDESQKMRLISKADMKEMEKGARWNDLLGHWGVVTMGMALKFKKTSLTHQSHEGALQFLHGMAASEAEQAWQTQHKIMLWAEFCYKISTGQILGETKLKDVTLAADKDFTGAGMTIKDLFAKWGDKTVSWLFTEKDSSPVVPQRALGSMLHMLQDTFCASHAQRVAAKKEGDVARQLKGFNVYTKQSASVVKGIFSKWANRHAIADELSKSGAKETAGAQEAVDIGAQVMKFYKEQADWNTVVKPYLLQVFALVPELEAQKPALGQTAPTGKHRLTSASGRLFRTKWLSDQFQSESSVWGKRRPQELKAIDLALKAYESLLKSRLNQLAQVKPPETMKQGLELEQNALGLAGTLARGWWDANIAKTDKATETRIKAVASLFSGINEDKKEIGLDLQSINEAIAEKAL